MSNESHFHLCELINRYCVNVDIHSEWGVYPTHSILWLLVSWWRRDRGISSNAIDIFIQEYSSLNTNGWVILIVWLSVCMKMRFRVQVLRHLYLLEYANYFVVSESVYLINIQAETHGVSTRFTCGLYFNIQTANTHKQRYWSVFINIFLRD